MEPHPRQSAAAREAILGAATELIRVDGVTGMSIADLIARSGTSAGAIYHHFGSKQGVVLEVARTAISRPIELVLGTPSEAGFSPAELMRAALAQVVRNQGTSEVLLQIWAGAYADRELAELLKEQGAGMRMMLMSLARSWCQANAPSVDPEGLTEVMIGLVVGYAVQRSILPEALLEAYPATAEHLLALLGPGNPPDQPEPDAS